MEERIRRLRETLDRAGLDAALLSSSENIRYFTGFTSDECEVVVTKGRTYLVTDFRYTIQAKLQTRGLCEIIEINPVRDQLRKVEEILVDNGCKSCAFEEDKLTVALFNVYEKMPVRFVPLGSDISILRVRKTGDEVEKLQKAQQLADAAFTKLVPELHVGMTESEVAAKLNYYCSLDGSEGPSFDPIVGSGPNGAMCHAVPGERRFEKGDFVVFDFGCLYDGYHSDMTRTVGFGPIDDELRKIYDITYEAQLLTLAGLKSGIGGAELDAIARDYITSKGYGENFGHGLGHGFGLLIHEPPRAGKSSSDILEPGMTVTVEPGIYIEGKGGVRIEDCCVVTEDGYINLVSFEKDLIILS